METETSKKQYESRHRLTWAARYPLKPGRDVASRRGLLLIIADAAITGEYWMSQEKLAEQLGLTARGVRKKLVKLCAEGALRAQHRGYRQTNIYTLMRLGEVAQYGDFLPLSDRNSSSSQAHDRNSSSTHDRNSSSKVTGTPVPPKEAIREEDIEQEEEAAAETPTSVDSSTAEGFAADLEAAAALNPSTNPKNRTARHACPNCERTWPKHFGPVCYECDTPQQRRADRNRKVLGFTEQTVEQRLAELDAEEAAEKEAAPAPAAPAAPLAAPAPPAAPAAAPAAPARPVSKTTRRLRAAARTESWLKHQGLDQLIGNRDLEEVCELMYAMGGGACEPEDFFEEYDRHLQDHKQAEADYLAPFPKPANNGLKTQDLRHTAERASGPGNKPKPANNGTSQAGLIPIGEALAYLPATAQARMAA